MRRSGVDGAEWVDSGARGSIDPKERFSNMKKPGCPRAFFVEGYGEQRLFAWGILGDLGPLQTYARHQALLTEEKSIDAFLQGRRGE